MIATQRVTFLGVMLLVGSSETIGPWWRIAFLLSAAFAMFVDWNAEKEKNNGD